MVGIRSKRTFLETKEQYDAMYYVKTEIRLLDISFSITYSFCWLLLCCCCVLSVLTTDMISLTDEILRWKASFLRILDASSVTTGVHLVRYSLRSSLI